jgi:hypothetical protein
MSASPQSNRDRLLPGPDDRAGGGSSSADGGRPGRGRGRSGSSSAPARQLADLPRDELEHLAEEYGLDPTRYKRRQDLVAAIHDRRQMIVSLDREAMLDVVRWGRRPVTANASKDQIAQEIARIRSMRFAGLSQRGLVVLARLRGVDAVERDDVPVLVKKLKRKEGFFGKLNRKRRSMVASWVARIIGEDEAGADYGYLPPAGQGSTSGAAAAAAGRDSSIKQEIEESGLIGGITSRLKKTADSYVNQKLDEIESRIDRKLDEIDRRLAEWRDREIANRIRILKITLWASVLVGAFSLIYSYVYVYFVPSSRPSPVPGPRPPVPQQVAPQK